MALLLPRLPLFCVIATLAALAAILAAPAGARAAQTSVSVFPIAGARVATPATQITFRGIAPSSLGSITVTGSKSGAHAGTVQPDSDGDGASFIPSERFTAGEQVTVHTGLSIVGGQRGVFRFTIARPASPIRAAGARRGKRVDGDVWRFASRPDLAPAAVRVTQQPSSHAAPGDLFVASQSGPVQNGPELIGPYGGLIYFKPVPHGDSCTDFRQQTYQGKPVLTWWQGRVSAAGYGFGEDEIYNTDYRPVATVRAGNGLQADLHEFQLSGQSTAWVTAYYPVLWNASKIKHGSRNQIVLDAVVQEIDVPTGLVLFQWDSLDHIALGDSHQPVPTVSGHPWDYFHVNSIQPQGDGNVIVSARDTWSAYDLSDQTAKVRWILGGKRSKFKMGSGTTFAFQHDVRMQRDGELTVFDDGAGPPVIHSQSRGLTLKLDTHRMTASLVLQDEHRPALRAAYEGNVQQLPNGDDFIGWGQQPYFSEYDTQGRQIFDARFVGNTDSYRAYRFPWNGTPVTLPAAAVRVAGRRRTVYASWNGAMNVARWQIVGGLTPDARGSITSARRSAFETAIRLPHAYHYVEVQALDSRGHVLGTSTPIKG